METKRDAILSAAMELFAEKGFHATSTREIARKAGTAEGNIYRHFPGKDELATHLFDHCAEHFHQVLTASILGVPRPDDQIRRLIEAIFDFAEQEPRQFAYLLSAYQAQLARPDRQPLPMGLFRQIILNGIEQGVFTPVNPLLAIGWIVGMTQRTISLHQSGRMGLPRTEVVAQTTEAALRLIEKR